MAASYAAMNDTPYYAQDDVFRGTGYETSGDPSQAISLSDAFSARGSIPLPHILASPSSRWDIMEPVADPTVLESAAFETSHERAPLNGWITTRFGGFYGLKNQFEQAGRRPIYISTVDNPNILEPLAMGGVYLVPLFANYLLRSAGIVQREMSDRYYAGLACDYTEGYMNRELPSCGTHVMFFHADHIDVKNITGHPCVYEKQWIVGLLHRTDNPEILAITKDKDYARATLTFKSLVEDYNFTYPIIFKL